MCADKGKLINQAKSAKVFGAVAYSLVLGRFKKKLF